MADKIEKYLSKLSKKQYLLVVELIKRILVQDLEGLDCKPLKGHKSIYRVRKGRIRIIFRIAEDGGVMFLQISSRDSQTYRDF